MNTLEPFTPNYGLGSNVTASSTSAIVPVSSSSNSICITNTGANIAYIRTGVTSATALISDYPILPYSQAIVTKPLNQNVTAYMSPLGTTLHIICGAGA